MTITLDPRVRRVRAERDRAATEMRSLMDEIEERGSDPTEDEDAKLSRLTEALDALDARMNSMNEDVTRAASIEAALAELGIETEREVQQAVSGDLDLLRSIAKGDKRSGELTAPLGIRFPGKIGERASLAVGAPATGGNLVPTTLVASLYEHLIETTSVFTWATVITTASGEAMDFPTTATFSTATLTAEAAAGTQSDPTFGVVTLDAYKYMLLMRASNEFLTDEAIGVVDFLARQASRAIRNGFGAHAIAGDGSAKPNGIVGAATAGKTGAAAAAGVFTAEDLIDLFYSVIAEYRSNGSWLMRDATMGNVRKLREDSGGAFLWQPAFAVGAPDTILGRPVATDPNVPAVAADARSVLFGDLSAYYVRQVAGIRVERSDDFAFNTDEVVWRVIWRGDGDLVDTTGAVKAFVGGAAS